MTERQALQEAVIELHNERYVNAALEQLLAKALAFYQRGQIPSNLWADQAMGTLRLIQENREKDNVRTT